jgi:hypothetical protein
MSSRFRMYAHVNVTDAPGSKTSNVNTMLMACGAMTTQRAMTQQSTQDAHTTATRLHARRQWWTSIATHARQDVVGHARKRGGRSSPVNDTHALPRRGCTCSSRCTASTPCSSTQHPHRRCGSRSGSRGSSGARHLRRGHHNAQAHMTRGAAARHAASHQDAGTDRNAPRPRASCGCVTPSATTRHMFGYDVLRRSTPSDARYGWYLT